MSRITTKAKGAARHRMITYEEVQKHASQESCWVIIEGQVYDATPILDIHPGGSAVILRNAGKDATKAFTPIHPPGTLSTLPPEAVLGPVDLTSLPQAAKEPSEEDVRIAQARKALPPPEAALNLRDVEEFAQKVLTGTAWAYYRSAADDETSYFDNFSAFKRLWFRPRVLNKVSKVSTESSMLSMPCSLPVYISPFALARLGHPDGEMNMTRAAAKAGIPQGISSAASCSLEEIMSVKVPEQSLIFQLYMFRDRLASEALIRKADKMDFKAIMLTVDAIISGKRELDQRVKAGDWSGPAASGKQKARTGLGVALSISGHLDQDLCWDDIDWIRSLTKLPVIIKGIQCVEDAEKAFLHGVQGIVLSNHGGRQLDYSPPGMEVLYELHQRRPDILQRRDFEVYVDGGVSRGSDIVKALCLGARAVGLGRAFLYGNSVWGVEGCLRVVQILQEEIITCMQLLGVTSVDQLTPDLVRYVDRGGPLPRTRL